MEKPRPVPADAQPGAHRWDTVRAVTGTPEGPAQIPVRKQTQQTPQWRKGERNMDSKKLILGAAMAGMVAGALSAPKVALAAGDKCYGVNKCKGTGACGGKGHSCHGKNECKGQGWLAIDKDTCLKIEGGSLTPKDEGKK